MGEGRRRAGDGRCRRDTGLAMPWAVEEVRWMEEELPDPRAPSGYAWTFAVQRGGATSRRGRAEG